jgi:hypothetical protein
VNILLLEGVNTDSNGIIFMHHTLAVISLYWTWSWD